MNELDDKITKPEIVPGSPEILNVFSKNAHESTSHATHSEDSAESIETEEQIEEEISSYNQSQSSSIGRIVKYVAPFVAVFFIGIFVYFFYFSSFSFSNIFKSQPKVASVSKQANLDTLYKTEKIRFETWMRGYYFDISDKSVLDPNTDLSGNGLTSFQKYILGLNPKVYDTLKLGKADSEYIQDGINPLNGNNLTEDQKKLIEQFVEVDVAVNKKKSYPVEEQIVITNPYYLRGEGYPVEPVDVVNTIATPTDNSGISYVKPNIVFVKPDVKPNLTGTYPNQSATPKYNKLNIPATQNYLDIDFSIPGKIEIPSINVIAPIQWPKTSAENDNALKLGVMRVPGTAEPGSLGTSYISGHSSGYAWDDSKFKTIFTHLNDVPDKASFYVYVTTKQGKLVKLTYIVNRRGEYTPQDPEQFKNTADSVVALGTCWPIGGTAKRKVIFGTLDKIDYQ